MEQIPVSLQVPFQQLLRKQTVETVAEKLAEILKTPYENRTASEQQALIQFLQNQKFFKERKMKDKDILEICYGLRFHQSPPGKNECRFAEEGDTFYIILSGKCSVWLPIANDNMRGPVKSFLDLIQQVAQQRSPQVPAELFQIRDKNDELITLSKLCEHYSELKGVSQASKLQFWRRFTLEASLRVSQKAQSFFQTKRMSVIEDQNDPFQILQAKNRLVGLSQHLLFKRTFEHRKDQGVGQIELSQQVKSKTSDFDLPFSSQKTTYRESQQNQSGPQEFEVSDSECSSQDLDRQRDQVPRVEEPLEEIDLLVESLGLANLRKKLLDSLFANNLMPNHMFSIDGKNLEFHKGMYFFQISELGEGQTFGELALISEDNRRNATVKCITKVTYGVLDKRNFDRSLKKIEQRRTHKLLEFLSSVPCFFGMKKTVITKFVYFMEKHKFIRKQLVYQQGTKVGAVYIVIKGEFEQERSLPSSEHQATIPLRKILGREIKSKNILAKIFTELQGVPNTFKMTIFGPGSLIGEEDVINRKQYSSTLRCLSQKGMLYKINVEDFQNFKNSQESWERIIHQVGKKEQRIRGKHIQSKAPNQTQKDDLIISQPQSPQRSSAHNPTHSALDQQMASQIQSQGMIASNDTQALFQSSLKDHRNTTRNKMLSPQGQQSLSSLDQKFQTLSPQVQAHSRYRISHDFPIGAKVDDFSLKGHKTVKATSFEFRSQDCMYGSNEILANHNGNDVMAKPSMVSAHKSTTIESSNMKDVFFTLGQQKNLTVSLATTLKPRSRAIALPYLERTPTEFRKLKEESDSGPGIIRLGRQAISQESRAYSQLSQILNNMRIRNEVQNPEHTSDFMERSDLSKWVIKSLKNMQARK